MASLITTMSVPIPLPAPSIVVSSSASASGPASAPPSSSSASIIPPLSLSPSPASSISHSNTIRTSRLLSSEPPSYLPPAIRAARKNSCGLTPPSNARTRAPFKPRSAAKGTSSYQLRQFAEATLGSGSLRKAVKLPEGEDLNEWLAVNGACSAHLPLMMAFIYLFYFLTTMTLPQWSISTIRLTCSMDPLPSSARRSLARR